MESRLVINWTTVSLRNFSHIVSVLQIETLKKFNKLFSDDNNYLRSRYSLLIPIEISIEKNPNFDSDLSSTQTSSSSLNGKDAPWASAKVNDIAKMPTSSHSMTFDQKNKTSSKYPKSPNKSISLCDSSHLDTNSDNNLAAQESVADFLIRIDSSIAKTRNQVEKMSKKIDEGSIEEELNRATTTKRFNTPKLATSEHSVLSSTSSSRSSLFPFDGDGNLRLSANNNSRSKKVKSSLKRFEKSQEEIFELWFTAINLQLSLLLLH